MGNKNSSIQQPSSSATDASGVGHLSSELLSQIPETNPASTSKVSDALDKKDAEMLTSVRVYNT